MAPALALCLALLAGYASAGGDVDAPIWPKVWSANFSESTSLPVIGNHSTNGAFYYDAPSETYRVDRQNGRYERYCGFNGKHAFSDEPCTHLVRNGMRYILYPMRKGIACCGPCYGILNGLARQLSCG